MKHCLALTLLMALAPLCWAYPANLVFEEEIYAFTHQDEVIYQHLSMDLATSFVPAPLQHYWISFQGKFSVVPPSYFYWSACLSEDYWGFEGMMLSSDLGFPAWTDIHVVTDTYMELAFVLETADRQEVWRQDPSEFNAISSVVSPGIESKSADDFFCTSSTPISRVQWWTYFSSPIPESIIVRIYEEYTAPVERSSWSQVKALY